MSHKYDYSIDQVPECLENTVVAESYIDKDYQECNLPQEILDFLDTLRPRKKNCLLLADVCDKIRKRIHARIMRMFPITRNMPSWQVVQQQNARFAEEERYKQIVNYWELKEIKFTNCANFVVKEGLKTEDGKTIYTTRNAIYCKDVLCPACSFRKMKKHGIQFYGIAKESEKDYDFYPLTLTIPNCKMTAEALSRHIDLLIKALRKMMSWKFWKDCVCGCFWAIDITANASSFHPHFHLLIVVPKDSEIFSEEDLRKNWKNAVAKCGLVSEYDLQIKLGEKIEQVFDKGINKKKEPVSVKTEENRCGNPAFMAEEQGYQTADIGLKDDSTATQVARWVMYCAKPIIYNVIYTNESKGKFEYIGINMKIDEFLNTYHERIKHYDYRDVGTCATIMEQLSPALRNKRLFGVTGVLKSKRKHAKDENKKRFEKLKEDNPDENRDKYLMRWNKHCDEYAVYRHVDRNSPYANLLDNLNNPKKKKATSDNPEKKKAISTLEKELPKNVKQLLPDDAPEPQPTTAATCGNDRSVNQSLSDLPEWMLREYPVVIAEAPPFRPKTPPKIPKLPPT